MANGTIKKWEKRYNEATNGKAEKVKALQDKVDLAREELAKAEELKANAVQNGEQEKFADANTQIFKLKSDIEFYETSIELTEKKMAISEDEMQDATRDFEVLKIEMSAECKKELLSALKKAEALATEYKKRFGEAQDLATRISNIADTKTTHIFSFNYGFPEVEACKSVLNLVERLSR